MNKKLLLIPIVLIAFIAVISSCKKTIGLDPIPQNKMLEYKVSNLTDTVIYGAIDNRENTITVYVPFYYGLSVIDPKIELDAGAKLKEDILPVDISNTTQTYTVTSSDGIARVYKLVIVQQNTPSLSLHYQDETNLITYPVGLLPNINGNFLSTNRELADITLIGKPSGKSVVLNKTSGQIILGRPDGVYSLQAINIPADIDTGYYNVKIGFLGHQVTMAKPVHIIHQRPALSAPGINFKVGDIITYNAYKSVILNPKSMTVTLAGKSYNWPIISNDLLELKVQVPDNFPIGNFSAYGSRPAVSFIFEGWPPYNFTQAMVSNPK